MFGPVSTGTQEEIVKNEEWQKEITSGEDLADAISCHPGMASLFLREKWALIRTGEVLVKIIQAVPTCADWLLINKNLVPLIQQEDQLKDIIYARPDCGMFLLKEKGLVGLIKSRGLFDEIADVVPCPRLKEFLCCHWRRSFLGLAFFSAEVKYPTSLLIELSPSRVSTPFAAAPTANSSETRRELDSTNCE